MMQRRNHHAERNARVRRHVQIGAANIEVAVAAAHEQQRGAAVDGDAKRRDQNDGQPRDRRRLRQAIDRLDDDAADRDQQQPGIEQRRQDRSPAIAVGVPLRRLLLRKPRRAPRQQQRNHVGEIVNGVRNQRQRVGGVAEDQFRNDERGIERGADGERPAETIRRVAVAGVTMGMIMPVGMIVMSVIVRHSASMNFNGDLYSATDFEYYYRWDRRVGKAKRTHHSR